METSVFDIVKSELPMKTVIRFYGFEPNRSGFIRCPFHAERTPSLKIYPDRYKCFGCGAGGDVIDFVSRLHNLDPIGAVKRLKEDFRLSIPQASDDWRQEHDARRIFEDWKQTILNKIDSAIRTANLADFRQLSEAEAAALIYREPLEYWADILMHGTLEQQMSVFRDREGVNKICKKILASTPRRLKTA